MVSRLTALICLPRVYYKVNMSNTQYHLTKEDLLRDLYIAFYDARKHKTTKPYVRFFERNLKQELESLCDDLWNRTYTAQPSRCFIIDYPKKREVFAAQFRDRVVHHLYFNYTHVLYERTFIQDSYSCIKNKGTLYGINRLSKHIRSESLNYTVPCWVLNIDIRGYFMHINREKLLKLTCDTIQKMATHKVRQDGECVRWNSLIDIDFVLWLTKEIAMLDPKDNCIIGGRKEDWDGLDKNKSLFYTENGCGLPIGNLTSQLFSNVYLNVFDQFMKRVLKCKHYTRYVDDARVISCDRRWLLSMVPTIQKFLKDKLQLELHMGKLQIVNTIQGSEFLGAFVKCHRTYVSNNALKRAKRKLSELNYNNAESVWRSTCSYLGMMIHYASYNIRKALFLNDKFLHISDFDWKLSKMNKPCCIT